MPLEKYLYYILYVFIVNNIQFTYMDVIKINKIITLVVVILIIFTTIFESVNAKISISHSNEKTILISCKYFTLNGIFEVEKTLKKYEADYLFNLLDTWDIEEILIQLERMKMLPENHDTEITFNLIKGQQTIQNLEKIDNNYSENSNKTIFDDYTNSLCFVKGHAVDSMFLNTIKSTLFPAIYILYYIDDFLLNFRLYPRISINPYGGELGLLGILSSLIGLYVFNIPSMPFPLKISPLLIAWLTDDRDEQYAELSTRGLTNNWSIEKYDISLLMIGFTGIWITKLLEDRSNPVLWPYRCC